MDPTLQALQERVRAAAAAGTPLMLVGSRTKAFYGNEPRGEALDVRPVAGIVDYEPTELVVTVRGGTPLWSTPLPAGPVGWIFGGEGAGLSVAAQAVCQRLVSIPIDAAVESLNVAAAVNICQYELHRPA